MICNLFPAPTYFLYSPDVPALLYYAQIPGMVIALLLSFYILFQNRHSLLNRLLFSISVLFSVWTIVNLITWTNINSNLILFVWSFFGTLFGLISVFCIYFIYVFLNKRDISKKIKIVFLGLLAPIIFFTPTYFNLGGFDITDCDAFKFEKIPFESYYTILGILAMVWIFVLLVQKYRTAVPELKKQIFLMGAGIELFIFSFFVVVFLASYLTGIGFLPDSGLELYGMVGMVIFMIYVSILVVRFHTFNIKLLATQALVWGLVALIGSQFFFIRTPINRVLNGITFAASIILGFYLVRSVKKEIEQRKQLATLLKQRESMVHLITHKVKGAFTRIKVLFAGMTDGTFGEVSPEIKRRAEQGIEFDNNGLQTVDLVLNVANIQNGLIKYDMKTLDFKNLVEEVVAEKKIPAEGKGLSIETETGDESYNVTGDAFWLKEVINNLIENSIRYTREGKIMVGLKKQNNKILFSVKDNGIGINDEDKKHLFTEGGRGAKSVEINVDSTGYGLFTVKLIVEAHAGRVWAESGGDGKGSQFYVELPAA